jgi:hypothetical protein
MHKGSSVLPRLSPKVSENWEVCDKQEKGVTFGIVVACLTRQSSLRAPARCDIVPFVCPRGIVRLCVHAMEGLGRGSLAMDGG